MPNLKHRVLEYIKGKAMPMPPAKLLVGLSGGMDSVALLRILQDLGFDLLAAHVNFGLRQEAKSDEEFCRRLCETLQIDFLSASFDTKERAARDKKGIQDAARKLRYEWFFKLAEQFALQGVALAHHADDQVETLLMTLLNGEAQSIFKGIPPQNGLVFRPLLGISKEELKTYLESIGQTWVEDISNSAEAYDRNFIRNAALPLLKSRFPGLSEVLLRKNESYQAQQAALDALFLKVEQAVVKQDGHLQKLLASELEAQLPSDQIATFLEWWASKRWKGKQVTELQKLWLAKPGATMQLGNSLLRKMPDGIHIEQAIDLDFESVAWKELPAAGSTHQIGAWELILDWVAALPAEKQDGVIYIYVQSADFPVLWRKPNSSERFHPLGMKGSKSISDLLADDKRSLAERENALVMESRRGPLCVLPGRIASIAADREGNAQLVSIRYRLSV